MSKEVTEEKFERKKVEFDNVLLYVGPDTGLPFSHFLFLSIIFDDDVHFYHSHDTALLNKLRNESSEEFKIIFWRHRGEERIDYFAEDLHADTIKDFLHHTLLDDVDSHD